MVRVTLGGALPEMAGGRTEFELEAKNVRQVLDGLARACPALAPALEEGVAVAIDGEINTGAWFTPVSEANEIYVLPMIAGG